MGKTQRNQNRIDVVSNSSGLYLSHALFIHKSYMSFCVNVLRNGVLAFTGNNNNHIMAYNNHCKKASMLWVMFSSRPQPTTTAIKWMLSPQVPSSRAILTAVQGWHYNNKIHYNMYTYNNNSHNNNSRHNSSNNSNQLALERL